MRLSTGCSAYKQEDEMELKQALEQIQLALSYVPWLLTGMLSIPLIFMLTSKWFKN